MQAESTYERCCLSISEGVTYKSHRSHDFSLRIAIDRTREINGLGYSAIRSVDGNQALQPEL